jgi:hypothetical protein
MVCNSLVLLERASWPSLFILSAISLLDAWLNFICLDQYLSPDEQDSVFMACNSSSCSLGSDRKYNHKTLFNPIMSYIPSG